MDNQPTHVQSLFLKYSVGTASQEEVQELLSLLAEGTYDEVVISQMMAQMTALESQSDLDRDHWGNLLSKIKLQTGLEKKQSIRLWPRVVAVAAAIAFIVMGVYFFNYNNGATDKNTNLLTQDVVPGRQGATLTLANGKKIRLTDAANGKLANEAGVVISKSEDGQLIYEIKNTGGENNKTNTLSTANGETYRLRLPDGSTVWLNAASSLTYSANLLNDGKRKVRLIGEGYFSVAKDKSHPFVVETAEQSVEVLGTEFNVNAYQNEQAIATTLLEGSVKITEANIMQMLKPGEQAWNTGTAIKVNMVDVAEATAWKDGDFQFNEEKLSGIMRKLERWYDVEIVLSDQLANTEFSGKISRNRNISDVLRMIEKINNIHFDIKGRRVMAIEK